MDLIFQFLRIMVFCFAGELCYNFLPLPIPASVYGLLLLLAALKLGWVKLEQVRTAALFPHRHLPAAVRPRRRRRHGPVGGASRHAAAGAHRAGAGHFPGHGHGGPCHPAVRQAEPELEEELANDDAQ